MKKKYPSLHHRTAHCRRIGSHQSAAAFHALLSAQTRKAVYGPHQHIIRGVVHQGAHGCHARRAERVERWRLKGTQEQPATHKQRMAALVLGLTHFKQLDNPGACEGGGRAVRTWRRRGTPDTSSV